ncbi:14012_t:CDS:2 [Entrophospora sp. SA101]|nr:14012_t:CDS:2 [Entrophospora sp. SA101]
MVINSSDVSNNEKDESNLLNPSATPSLTSSLSTLKNTFILFRHGQSKANVSKIVVASLKNDTKSNDDENDWGLTVLGKKQVENIYTSPFSRTIETAKIIHDHISNHLTNLEPRIPTKSNNENTSSSFLLSLDPIVTVHQQLCERNFGIFELKSDHESYHKVWSIDENINSISNNNDNDEEYKRLGVETCWEVRRRMCDVIYEIEKESKVNISHGDSLQILQTAFENVDPNNHRKLNYLGTAEWRIFNNKMINI